MRWALEGVTGIGAQWFAAGKVNKYESGIITELLEWTSRGRWRVAEVRGVTGVECCHLGVTKIGWS